MGNKMVDVIISGETGKIHAVYHKSATEIAPLAVILPGNLILDIT